MDISLNLDKDFSKCLGELKEKYGEKFETMNGFAKENLNFTDFIDNFINTNTVADITIDGNANSNTKDIRTLLSDMTKPHQKLFAYNKIFYELKKQWGIAIAREWLETEWNGGFYLHNAHTSSYYSYCFAYDLDQVAEKGLYFIEGLKTEAPKHMSTFNDHVLEFISWASNRTSGKHMCPFALLPLTKGVAFCG